MRNEVSLVEHDHWLDAALYKFRFVQIRGQLCSRASQARCRMCVRMRVRMIIRMSVRMSAGMSVGIRIRLDAAQY